MTLEQHLQALISGIELQEKKAVYSSRNHGSSTGEKRIVTEYYNSKTYQWTVNKNEAITGALHQILQPSIDKILKQNERYMAKAEIEKNTASAVEKVLNNKEE